MQRVRIAAGGGAFGGDQRLRQDLPAEYPPPTIMRRMSDELVVANWRKVEQCDEFVRGHGPAPVAGSI